MSGAAILLALLILAGLIALAWRDFVEPRKQRRIRRARRREARRFEKVRLRIWLDLFSLRKTRRLTDQRGLNRARRD